MGGEQLDKAWRGARYGRAESFFRQAPAIATLTSGPTAPRRPLRFETTQMSVLATTGSPLLQPNSARYRVPANLRRFSVSKSISGGAVYPKKTRAAAAAAAAAGDPDARAAEAAGDVAEGAAVPATPAPGSPSGPVGAAWQQADLVANMLVPRADDGGKEEGSVKPGVPPPGPEAEPDEGPWASGPPQALYQISLTMVGRSLPPPSPHLWFQRLKHSSNLHKLLPTFAFNINLRRYPTATALWSGWCFSLGLAPSAGAYTRSQISSTQLELFCPPHNPR